MSAHREARGARLGREGAGEHLALRRQRLLVALATLVGEVRVDPAAVELIQATAGVADEEQGLASGLVNTSFQVGGAIVTAVVSAVVTSGAGGLPTLASLDNGVIVIIASASLGLVVRRSAPRPTTTRRLVVFGIPLSFASLGTGIALGLGSKWG